MTSTKVVMKAIKATAEFEGWISGLKDRAAVGRIQVRIRRLSLGNPGKVRNLKVGVSEMKIDFGPGYRVYYTEHGGEIVILLCGGTKKQQGADIAKAEKLAKDVGNGR